MSVSKVEVEEACRVVRQRVPGGDYIANIMEAQQATIERMQEEMDLVRKVIRAGDYAQDTRYAEARAALSKFDREKK